MEDKIYKWIYDWVAENFGESEADDPSWDIHALAGELCKHRTDIFYAVEREFLEMDCDEVAERNGIKLTDEEREWVINEYQESSQYTNLHEGVWESIMRYAKENK